MGFLYVGSDIFCLFQVLYGVSECVADKRWCQITKGWVVGLGFRARQAMRAGFSGPWRFRGVGFGCGWSWVWPGGGGGCVGGGAPEVWVGWGGRVMMGGFIQKGEKTDLVAEIGRFFKQNIYLLVQIIVCLAPFVSKGLYEV